MIKHVTLNSKQKNPKEIFPLTTFHSLHSIFCKIPKTDQKSLTQSQKNEEIDKDIQSVVQSKASL